MGFPGGWASSPEDWLTAKATEVDGEDRTRDHPSLTGADSSNLAIDQVKLRPPRLHRSFGQCDTDNIAS